MTPQLSFPWTSGDNWLKIKLSSTNKSNNSSKIQNEQNQQGVGPAFGRRAFQTKHTKRLDKATKEPEPAEEQVKERGPNYEMDEFDRLNPFYDDFRPDAETPPPTPPPSPTTSPEEEEDEDDFPPPPPEENRKTWEEPAATSSLKSWSESVDLQTVNRLIKQYDPNYKVKSKESKLHNYSVEDLKKVRDKIYKQRGEPQLQETARSPLDDDSWEREMEGSG